DPAAVNPAIVVSRAAGAWPAVMGVPARWGRSEEGARMARRGNTIAALAGWGFVAWAALLWTQTIESSIVGVAVSLLVAWSLAPLGPVARPWRLLEPRRILSLVRLTAF